MQDHVSENMKCCKIRLSAASLLIATRTSGCWSWVNWRERAAADMHTDSRTDHRTQLLVTAARLNRPGYRLGGAHLQYVDIAAASGRVLLKYESFLMSFITLRRAIMSCPDVSTCKWEFSYTAAIAECPSGRQQWMPAGFQPGFARISPET